MSKKALPQRNVSLLYVYLSQTEENFAKMDADVGQKKYLKSSKRNGTERCFKHAKLWLWLILDCCHLARIHYPDVL